jgi:hypothetical protein
VAPLGMVSSERTITSSIWASPICCGAGRGNAGPLISAASGVAA